MNREAILFLFGYHYWANERILDRLDCAGPERFDAPTPHGSLRSILVHTLGAEVIWRQRMQEHFSPSAMPAFVEVRTPDDLRAAWVAHQAKMRAYLEGLSDADLRETFRYRRTNGEELEYELGRTLAHVVNHGTQHRSEAAMLLTDYGCSPGDLDMSLYLGELDRGNVAPF